VWGSLRPVLAAATAVAVGAAVAAAPVAAKPSPKQEPIAVTVTLVGDPIAPTQTPPAYDPSVSGTATVNGDPATYTGTLEIGPVLPERVCYQCNAASGELTVTTADGTVTITLDPKRSYVTWTGGANREPGFHIVAKPRMVTYLGARWQTALEGFYSRHAAFSYFDPSVGAFVYTTEADAGELTGTLRPR
jgi:hypothetical protein